MRKYLILFALLLPWVANSQNIQKWQQKADKGNAAAKVELALHYEYGYGVAVDIDRAYHLLQEAAAAGNADAKAHLAFLYYNYLGYHAADTTLLRLAQEADAAGSGYGSYMLSKCYYKGIGVERNYAKGKQLVEKAVKRKCPEAILNMATNLIHGSSLFDADPATALKMLKSLKEDVHSISKFNRLAYYYTSISDYEQTRQWLNRGIAVNDPESRLDSYYLLFFGNGAPMNEREAITQTEYELRNATAVGDSLTISSAKDYLAKMYTIADDTTLHRHDLALQYYLDTKQYGEIGTSYYFGNFTPIDTNLAVRYWRKGFDIYDDLSIVQLMSYYQQNNQTDSMMLAFERGRSIGDSRCLERMAHTVVDTNPNLAIQYYEAASRHGKFDSYLYAAYVYANNGNMNQALACCDRALAHHVGDAYIVKANLYNRQNDEKKALKVLDEGAKQGVPQCNTELADYYANRGNFSKAESYLLAAGTPDALFDLAQLYLNGQMTDDPDAGISYAIALFHRAANMGHIESQLYLAICHYEGLCNDSNPDSAFFYAQQCIPNPGSLMLLGRFYEEGVGTTANLDSAMHYYTQAAQNGNVTGYVRLASIYAEGKLGEPDPAKAYYYYTLAAEESGDSEELLQVALYQLQGYGTPIDTAAAILSLREAIERDDNATAAGLLGEFYNKGIGGLPLNGDSASYYFHIGSQGDDPLSDLRLGATIYDEGDYARALPFLVSSARHGNADAIALYANALVLGQGIEPNPEAGIDFLNDLIHNHQNPSAYYYLGRILLSGSGIDTANPEQGLLLLDTAAALNHGPALFLLTRLYANSQYVEPDTVRAFDYLQRAAAQNYRPALLALGNCYRQGQLTQIDLKRAAEYYQKAADRGSLEGICRLGLCYENGDGVILNSRRAFELYTQAAEDGSSFGMRLLAYCYVDGIHVKKDPAQAAHWFLQAAEAGDLQSIYVIGKMYATGEGVKKDKKEARKWLTIAHEYGIEEAKDYLDRL